MLCTVISNSDFKLQLCGETWSCMLQQEVEAVSMTSFLPHQPTCQPHCCVQQPLLCLGLSRAHSASSWTQMQRCGLTWCFCIFPLQGFSHSQSDQRVEQHLPTSAWQLKRNGNMLGENLIFNRSSLDVNMQTFVEEWHVSKTHWWQTLHTLLYYPVITRILAFQCSGCIKMRAPGFSWGWMCNSK